MSKSNEIKWIKCKKCGLLQYKDHLRCLNCKHDQFDMIEASGDCILLTYTILKAPPLEFRDQQSYALGIVEFSNGIRAIGQLTSQENLKLGMKLKLYLKKVNNYPHMSDNGNHDLQSNVFKPIY